MASLGTSVALFAMFVIMCLLGACRRAFVLGFVAGCGAFVTGKSKGAEQAQGTGNDHCFHVE